MNRPSASGMLRAALAAAVVAVLAAVTVPATASAAEIREGDTITIGAGETIRDDVYAFGSTVDVEGRVEGDLIAFASVVNVDGEVTGDVITGSSTVDIAGVVGGSVRAGSGQIDVTGDIAEDLVVGAGRARVSSEGSVGRDVIAGTGDIDVLGDVGRDLKAGTGSITLAGEVGGGAEVSAGSIDFEQGASVGGDFVYWADSRQDVPSDAVGGEVVFHRVADTRMSATDAFLLWLFSWLRGLVAMAVLTLLVTLVFPYFSVAAADVIRHRAWLSLGVGAAIFFGVPIVAAIVFGFGILVGGWWIGLAIFALYLIALAVSVVVAAVFVGLWVLRALSRGSVLPVWAGLLGLLIIWLVRLVPVLGSIVLFVAMLFGLGAMTIAAFETARRVRAEPTAGMREPLV